MSKQSQMQSELKAALNKLGIRNDRNDRTVLAATFLLLEAYDESFNVEDTRGPMLIAMSKLPGGIKALTSALAKVDVQAALDSDRQHRDTLSDGIGFGESYRSSLFWAVQEFHEPYWYFHPSEKAAADRDGRDCEQGHYDDVYHVGLFALCEVVECAYLDAHPPRKSKPRYSRYFYLQTESPAISR